MPGPSPRTVRWILFFVFCACALFCSAGNRPLSEPDELRYLEVAREMEEQGSWIVPLYNYQPYLDKGPFFFYLLAGARRLTQDPFRAALLPAQFFSFLSLLAAFALFKLWGWSDRRIALSLVLLLSSGLFLFLARFCRMDAVLACCILVGYLALFFHMDKRAPWAPALYGLCLALGLLTKGPVALIWMWLVPLAETVRSRDRRIPACLFHPGSLLVTLLLLLSWLLPAYGRLGWDLVEIIFIRQTEARLIQASDHAEPLFYYFYALPAAAFPATFYFLRGLFLRPSNRTDAFMLWWLLLPLALFSLFSGKIVIYLLPLLPAVSGLAGTALDRLLDGPPKACRWGHLATAIPFLLAGVTVWAGRGHDRWANLQEPLLALAASLVLAGLVLTVWAVWRPRTFIGGLAAAMIFLTLVPIQSLLRQGLPHQTTLALARTYVRLAEGQSEGYSYQDLRPSYLYCLRKPVVEMIWPHQLRLCLDAGHAVLIRDRVYASLPNTIKESTQIVASQKLTRRAFYIIKAKRSGLQAQ